MIMYARAASGTEYIVRCVWLYPYLVDTISPVTNVMSPDPSGKSRFDTDLTDEKGTLSVERWVFIIMRLSVIP